MSKAFKFPLVALRKHREHKLAIAKKEFLLVENKIVDLKAKLQEMHKSRANLFTQDIIGALGHMSLAGHAAMFEMQKKRIEQTELSIKEYEVELERHRRWLAEMNREMKALDKLEEKMRQRWENERKRKEQKQGDSWVAIHWARQNKEDVA